MPDARRLEALRWSLPDALVESSGGALLLELAESARGSGKRIAAKLEQRLREWLAALPGRPADASLGLESVAWTHALSRRGTSLPAPLASKALEALAATAQDATALDETADPLAWQLLAAELPLALAREFSDIHECRALAENGAAAMCAGLDLLLDGEGMPRARSLPIFRPLLACWTRCLGLAEPIAKADISPDALVQFDWAVCQSLRLMRCDGGQLGASGKAGEPCPELFDAALRHCQSQAARQLAERLLPAKSASGGPSDIEPAEHSAWACVSLLRSSLDRKSPRMLVTFADRQMQCELAVERQTLLAGDWTLRLSGDGRPLSLSGDWQEVCWHVDEQVVYLELEAPLERGWRVQRQMALARKANWLFLADAILGEREAALEYEATIPLGPEITFEPALETSDATLAFGIQPVASLMPLALPEWRSQLQREGLVGDDRRMILRQSGRAQRLFAPLFVDLDRRRARQERTWRHLTVGEDRQIVPRDLAVGYRMQSGRDQWAAYRSLGPSANRTVLGQNRTTEFFLVALRAQGKVETIVDVESQEDDDAP